MCPQALRTGWKTPTCKHRRNQSALENTKGRVTSCSLGPESSHSGRGRSNLECGWTDRLTRDLSGGSTEWVRGMQSQAHGVVCTSGQLCPRSQPGPVTEHVPGGQVCRSPLCNAGPSHTELWSDVELLTAAAACKVTL